MERKVGGSPKKAIKKICYLQIMIEKVWAYGYIAIKSGLHRI